MASIIYKDGKSIRVKYDALKRHLDAGWSTTETPEKKPVESPMGDYERELRDKIKALNGKVGGRASIKTIEKKLAQLQAQAEIEQEAE